jgi:hypothetical protein
VRVPKGFGRGAITAAVAAAGLDGCGDYGGSCGGEVALVAGLGPLAGASGRQAAGGHRRQGDGRGEEALGRRCGGGSGRNRVGGKQRTRRLQLRVGIFVKLELLLLVRLLRLCSAISGGGGERESQAWEEGLTGTELEFSREVGALGGREIGARTSRELHLHKVVQERHALVHQNVLAAVHTTHA